MSLSPERLQPLALNPGRSMRRHRVLFTIGCLVLATLGAATASATEAAWPLHELTQADPSERYALLIGISKYPPGIDRLPGPEYDAPKFAELLINQYGYRRENVLVILNEQATRDTIIRMIREHLGKARGNGTALFYYVGHGVLLKDNYSISDKETNDVDQALQVWSRNKNKSSIVLDDELGFLLDGLGARRTLAIIDSCFSGTMTKHVKLQMKLAFSALPRPRIVPMFVEFEGMQHYDFPKTFVSDNQPITKRIHVSLGASRENEVAFSVENWGSRGSRSVFSYHLEMALRAKTSMMSIEQLYGRVRGQVENDAVCKVKKSCQHPQRGGPPAALDAPISSFLSSP
jgi:hypothetical protein